MVMGTKFTVEKIAELRNAINLATGVEKLKEYTNEDGQEWIDCGDNSHYYFVGDLEDTCDKCHYNEHYVVAACNTLPTALDEIERLQKLLAKATALIRKEAEGYAVFGNEPPQQLLDFLHEVTANDTP